MVEDATVRGAPTLLRGTTQAAPNRVLWIELDTPSVIGERPLEVTNLLSEAATLCVDEGEANWAASRSPKGRRAAALSGAGRPCLSWPTVHLATRR